MNMCSVLLASLSGTHWTSVMSARAAKMLVCPPSSSMVRRLLLPLLLPSGAHEGPVATRCRALTCTFVVGLAGFEPATS